MSSPSIETLLLRMRAGDESARDALFAALYEELHGRARVAIKGQAPGHTLQATDLVNEAAVRLLRGKLEVQDRLHFLRLASQAMRQILVDHARRKLSLKKQPPGARIELDSWVEEFERRSGGLIALDAALERLEANEPELARVVELYFFGGCSMAETAEALGLSKRTAERRLKTARLYLKKELQRG